MVFPIAAISGYRRKLSKIVIKMLLNHVTPEMGFPWFTISRNTALIEG